MTGAGVLTRRVLPGRVDFEAVAIDAGDETLTVGLDRFRGVDVSRSCTVNDVQDLRTVRHRGFSVQANNSDISRGWRWKQSRLGK